MFDPASGEAAGPVRGLAGWLLTAVSGVALTGATLVITADVVLRYVFNAPLLWSMELNEMLLPLLVFGCLPYVWERRAHVHMELLVRAMSARGQALSDMVAALASGLFSAFLAIGMMRSALDMYQYNQKGEYLSFPFWPIAGFGALIGLVMTMQFLVHAAGAMRRIVRS